MKHKFEVNVTDQSLSIVSSYGYLGIEVDETLIWHTQIDIMTKKISSGLGAIKRFVILYPARH